MSKVLTSPVARFPGQVTLPDYLTYPQALAMEDAIEAAKALEKPSQRRYQFALLPGLCACVEAWEIKGVPELTPERFPASPSQAAAELLAWLVDSVMSLFNEADALPNA